VQGAREVFRYDFRHFRIVIGDQKNRRLPGHRRRTKTTAALSKSPPNADLFEDQFEVMASHAKRLPLSQLFAIALDRHLRGTEGVHFTKLTLSSCEPLDKKSPLRPKSTANRSPASPSNSKCPSRPELLVPHDSAHWHQRRYARVSRKNGISGRTLNRTPANGQPLD